MPVYYAGGTVSKAMDSDVLATALQARGVPAVWVPDYDRLMSGIMKDCQSGEVVLCVGARDPGIPRFARELVNRLG
jgi:UDP-N-acetylmuramate--alanine ligase